MSTYDQFAYIYDSLMSDIPYDKYTKWVLDKAPIFKNKRLMDIGCGTGVLSVSFAKAGYDVIGIDLSESMLTVAQTRSIEENTDITFLCQSMTDIEGISQVDVAVIAIDSLNYLETLEEVEQTFLQVYSALNEGGQLFFDIHSEYKMCNIFPDGPFTYEDEQVAYIWNTEQGEEDYSIYHDITFFVREEQSGYYKRFEESHYQRSYPLEVYLKLLEQVGFSEITTETNIFGEQPSDEIERYFIRAIK